MQLLGEQVNTEVAVLASSSRGRDADDLARTALQDQDVAHADVVARDGDGVGNTARLVERPRSARGTADLMVVVVVEDFVGHFVKSVTDRVMMSRFVVISHSRLLSA